MNLPRTISIQNNNFSMPRQPGHMDSEGKYTHYSLTPVEVLQNSGPDFNANMFDIFFIWRSNSGNKDITNIDDVIIPYWFNAYEKEVLSHKGFAVRQTSVKIPHILNNSFSIPFLETNIQKIRSTKEFSHESQFTLRLDQDLVWLDWVQGMQGRYIKKVQEPQSPTAQFAQGQSMEQQVTQLNVYSKNPKNAMRLIQQSWPAGVRPAEKNLITMYELCLIVKMQHLSTYYNINKNLPVLPYFMFEGVKILGTGDSIEYASDSSDIQEITIPFIFKRYHQIITRNQNDAPEGNQQLKRTTNNISSQEELDLKDTQPIPDINIQGQGV